MLLSIHSVSQGLSFACVNGSDVRLSYGDVDLYGQETSFFSVIKSALDLGVEEKISEIVVVRGPGSFTGTRVGLSIAHGLACGWNVPLFGISLSDVMCFVSYTYHNVTGPLQVLIDTKRGDFYSCEYNSFFEPLSKEKIVPNPSGLNIAQDYVYAQGTYYPCRVTAIDVSLCFQSLKSRKEKFFSSEAIYVRPPAIGRKRENDK